MKETKHFTESGTIKFNILAGMLFAALEPVMHEFKPMLGTFYYPLFMVFIITGNVFYRFKTNQGIRIKKDAGKD